MTDFGLEWQKMTDVYGRVLSKPLKFLRTQWRLHLERQWGVQTDLLPTRRLRMSLWNLKATTFVLMGMVGVAHANPYTPFDAGDNISVSWISQALPANSETGQFIRYRVFARHYGCHEWEDFNVLQGLEQTDYNANYCVPYEELYNIDHSVCATEDLNPIDGVRLRCPVNFPLWLDEPHTVTCFVVVADLMMTSKSGETEVLQTTAFSEEVCAFSEEMAQWEIDSPPSSGPIEKLPGHNHQGGGGGGGCFVDSTFPKLSAAGISQSFGNHGSLVPKSEIGKNKRLKLRMERKEIRRPR